MNYLMTLLASALGSCTLGSPDGEVPVLTPEVFIETARADSTAFILDVRRPGEFAEGHLEGAQLLDWLDQPAFIEGIKHFDKKRTYYLYCRSGRRAEAALTELKKAGYTNVTNHGGYEDLVKKGLK